MAELAAARDMARSVSLTPNEAERHGLALNKDGQGRSAFELMSHPDIGVARLAQIWPLLAELPPKIAEQLEIDAKYEVYLSRQAADIAAYRRDESLELPEGLDYAQLRGLSNEVRHKLQTLRPRTIGAGRIDGPPRGADAACAPEAEGSGVWIRGRISGAIRRTQRRLRRRSASRPTLNPGLREHRRALLLPTCPPIVRAHCSPRFT
jgi:tRNA uridine 5-carboxymethylaminomethyl modification enzyme